MTLRADDREWIAEYLRPAPGIGVPRPQYEGRSIANLSSSILRAAGGRTDGGPPIAPPLEHDLDPFAENPAVGPIIVVLIDGLGWGPFWNWTERAHSEEARRWGNRARPITTIFPTTTTSALTSLSTGTPPGRHGLVGYRQFLPQYGIVANMLKMSPVGIPQRDLLVGPRWIPSLVVGAPPMFLRGVNGVALSRDRFANQGFTRMLYEGAEYVGYATATDLGHELLGLLNRSSPPGVILVYWDELDTIQHLKGPLPELFDFELGQFARLIDFVVRNAPKEIWETTTLIITGDHGQVPTSREASIALELDPHIVSYMARPLSGDRRAGFLSARPGQLNDLKAALVPRLPRGSTVLLMADAVTAGLFGPAPFHPELMDRLGDLLVLVPSPAGLTYSAPGAAEPSRYLLGGHGGLEPDELIVPFITSRLADFLPRSP